MIDSIEFDKLSGSGNDFICIDNRQGQMDEVLDSPARAAHFVRLLCSRGMGVGADGVIFACRSEVEEVADLMARLFEPDGSEAELCGNGTACFVRWAAANGWTEPHEQARILTPAGIVRGCSCDESYVRVCIPDPQGLEMGFELAVNSRRFSCDFSVTGVPHVVAYVDDLAEMEIHHWGPTLRYHPRFQPRGANANFVQVVGEGELSIRTWEFGVEGETLACGTGSASAAVLAALRLGWGQDYLTGGRPVLVHSRSGDVLRIHFTRRDDGVITDVCLETIVRYICHGQLHEDLLARVVPAPAAQAP